MENKVNIEPEKQNTVERLTDYVYFVAQENAFNKILFFIVFIIPVACLLIPLFTYSFIYMSIKNLIKFLKP